MKKSIMYAGAWVRLLATLIDAAMLLVIIFTIMFFFYGHNYFGYPAQHYSTVFALINYGIPVLFILTFWMLSSSSPGKMICKITIVDSNTLKPITKIQAIWRLAMYVVSVIPALLGLIWIVFNRKKRAWHDFLSRTAVIKDPNYYVR